MANVRIRAGDLDRRIRIFRRGEPIDNGMGEKPGDWETLADVRAMQRVKGGSERYELDAKQAERKMHWRVRYSSTLADLNPKDCLQELSSGVPVGPKFQITSVEPFGRRVGLDIMSVAIAD